MEPLSQATREILWNISHVWLIYALFAVVLAFFGFGVYRRIQFWKAGKADDERFTRYSHSPKCVRSDSPG